MQKKRNIHVLMIISLLQGMVFYASIATLYRQAAGLTIFQITLIESVSLFLTIALEVPWGLLAERIGYRRTMICSSFIYFVSKIIFWQAQDFGGFLAERILLAAALAGLSGVEESIFYASCPEDEFQKVLGRTQALGTAGLLAASAVCTLWIGDNYRLAGLLTMIAYGLAIPCTLFLTETRPPEREPRAPLSVFRTCFRQICCSRGLLPLILGGALAGEAVQVITVFLNQLQYTRCGWSTPMISAAYILATLAEMGSIWSDPLTRRLGERRTGTLLLLLPAVCCGVLTVTENGWLSLTCLILVCLSMSLYGPLSGVIENRLITVDDRATALSISSLFSDSTAILLNLLLGRAADVSLPLAMALGGLFCLLAAGLFRCSARQWRPAQQQA